MSTTATAPGVEQNPTFPVMDTLRAVAALAVLTTHVSFQTGDYVRHGIIGALLSRLDIGVAVFFVLSGFLLSRPYLARAMVGATHPPTGRYYWKRFIRIFPVYAVTVVLAFVVISENHGAGVLAWLQEFTLTDVFASGRLPQGLTQMWSLSVEVTFYLVLPLLMALLLGRGRPRPWRILAVLGAGTLLSCWWNVSLAASIDRITSGTPLLWLPAHLTWFLVGIALAAAHLFAESGSRSRAVAALVVLGRTPGACWTAAAGVLLVAATPLGGPILLLVATPTQSLVKHLSYALIAGLVVLTGVFATRGGTYTRVMSLPWLRHLGHISYSVFCVHLIVLHVVRDVVNHQLFTGHWFEIWALTIAVTLVAAELLYRFVERPCLRLKNLGRSNARGDDRAQVETSTAITR